MANLGYQLLCEERGWSGYYIWTNKELAQEMCEQMNKDSKSIGIKCSYTLKEVEII